MICYFCQKEVQTGFYWAPLPRIGTYAAICRECHKKEIEAELFVIHSKGDYSK